MNDDRDQATRAGEEAALPIGGSSGVTGHSGKHHPGGIVHAARAFAIWPWPLLVFEAPETEGAA